MQGAGRLDSDGSEEAVGYPLTAGAVVVEVVRPFRLRVGRHDQAIGHRLALGGGGVGVVPHGAAGVLRRIGEAVGVERGAAIVELVREIDDQTLSQVGTDDKRLDRVLTKPDRHFIGERGVLFGADLRNARVESVHVRVRVVVAEAVERHLHVDRGDVIAAVVCRKAIVAGIGLPDEMGGFGSVQVAAPNKKCEDDQACRRPSDDIAYPRPERTSRLARR